MERREAERDYEEAPKSKKQMVPVPRYKTIEAVLGLDVDDEQGEEEGVTLTRAEIGDRAAALLKDFDAQRAFLQTGKRG